MLKSKARWMVQTSDEEKIEILVKELNISPLVASLLVNRGFADVESAHSFLFDQKAEFHDPFLFTDMDKAVQRIKEAIEKQEPILIYGDYDADGVSSTSVMMLTLRDLGANVQFYIPNRFTEGYGPNENAFRHAAENGIKLIITVDTGISALHEADVAKDLGVDLIITDHHEPGPILPNAYSIIHPKLENSTYPFRELAGVGVAFKLAHALYGQVPEHLCEIAAIGTIADLVSLTGENRLIAKKGIEKLKTTKNIGLKALFKNAGIDQGNVDEDTIGFSLAPRINAAGRLDSAEPAVQLILTNDPYEAEDLAEEIEQLNRERQAIVNAITEEAIAEVENNFPISENSVLVIGKEGWNPGVIGIVASRLVEKYYRPTIVLCFDREKGTAKGSARSIAGFDLFQNLSTCRELLPHFGGHPMAAGMTLDINDVDELRQRLNQLANEQLSEEDFIPITQIDTEVSLSHIDLSSIQEMQLLAPYGMDNPKPKVMIKDVMIANIRKIGADQNHLKVTLEHSGVMLDGVGFGLGHLFEDISPTSPISVIGELSINEWNNMRKPQIFLQDIAIDSWQLFDFRGLKRIERIIDVVPPNDRKWLVFQQENKDRFQRILSEEVLFIESIEQAQKLEVNQANIVYLDMPSSKQLLEATIVEKAPARIYVHFFKEESDFFSTMPTRDHFKWYYSFLLKKGPFDLKRLGDDLAKHRGWTRQTIDFMSKVFFELNFVTINNGFISIQSGINKRDLTESKTYQMKQAQFALENDLLYSSYQQLKSWFDEIIEGTAIHEEAMEQWI